MTPERKREIEQAMQCIVKRRPGKRKLVYDHATRTIVSVDRKGLKTPTGLVMHDD